MTNRTKRINTDQQVKSLKPCSEKYSVTVALPTIIGGSLIIQVNPGGTKTFYCRYRFDGKQHELKVGRYPSRSLKDAVIIHNVHIELVDIGINPKERLAEEAAKASSEPLMSELFYFWHESYSRNDSISPSCAKAHKWRWEKYLFSELGHMRVINVKRKHLAIGLDSVSKSSKEETRKCMTTLNYLMRFAQSRGFIEDNPCLGLSPKDFQASPSEPRQRWLSMAEISQLWNYLDNTENKISLEVKTAIKLAILTGARRSELARMEISELDLQKGIWTLPASRSKNGKAHVYHLHTLSQKLINELIKPDKKYLLSSPKKFGQSLSPYTLTRAVNRISTNTKMESFTFHDLRRSAATNWAEELKADHHLIELMLNHQPQNKLVRTYQIAKREIDQKELWHQWDNYLSIQLVY
jgi:integrase